MQTSRSERNDQFLPLASDRPNVRSTAPVEVDMFLIGGAIGDQELLERSVRDDAVNLAVHQIVAGSSVGSVIREIARGRPSLALIDAGENLQRACAILAQVRAEPSLAALPVVVVGGLRDQRDVATLMSAGASTAVPKPPFVDLFLQTLRGVMHYWTHVAVLPAVGMPQAPYSRGGLATDPGSR